MEEVVLHILVGDSCLVENCLGLLNVSIHLFL